MPPRKKRVPGCENCRERHLKCDGKLPCARCVKTARSCRRPVRFRLVNASDPLFGESTDFQFSPHQIWFKTQQHIKFIDQTVEIERHYDDVPENEDLSEPLPEADHSKVAGESDKLPTVNLGHDENGEGTPRSAVQVAATCQPWGISTDPKGLPDVIWDGRDTIPPIIDHDPLVCQEGSHTSSRGHYGRLVGNRLEAELIRHFIDELGPSLDPWDESRRFAADLVEDAISQPELMDTIMAAAAAHCKRTANKPHPPRFWSPTMMRRREQNCVSTSPFVALLRRTIENLDESVMQDGRLAQDFWVMGEASLHEAATAASESIKDKALWFGLWQELYISSMHHAPLSEHVNVPAMHRLTHGSDDRTWTNRMLLHLAEIVTYCYSEERNTTTYNRLVSYSATWMESKPPTFDPVYVRDAQGAMFPEIWLLNDVVAAGLQYYHLVKILLLAYNPRVPLLGAAQRAAKERGDVRAPSRLWVHRD